MIFIKTNISVIVLIITEKVVSVVHAWDSGETNDPKNWGMHLALILTMLVCLYMVIQWLERLT